jgi:Domain of unknown function (DUF4232)
MCDYRLSQVVLGVALAMSFLGLTVSPVDKIASASTVTPSCTFSQLEVAVGSGSGAFSAAGSHGIPFLIVNTSRSSCTLKGYPQLSFFPRGYKTSTIKVIHDRGMIFVAVKPSMVTIKPGAVASFGLNYGDAANQKDPSGGPCLLRDIYVALPLRIGTLQQSFDTTVNFNFCYTGFEVGVTPIEARPLPKQV